MNVSERLLSEIREKCKQDVEGSSKICHDNRWHYCQNVGAPLNG
jgi:hypothetical protein